MMPASMTSKPPALMPADSAEARKSPETRVSRPISARRRPSGWPSRAPESPSTRTAASPRSSASLAVRSRFASPRTPSVPNILGIVTSSFRKAARGRSFVYRAPSYSSAGRPPPRHRDAAPFHRIWRRRDIWRVAHSRPRPRIGITTSFRAARASGGRRQRGCRSAGSDVSGGIRSDDCGEEVRGDREYGAGAGCGGVTG